MWPGMCVYSRYTVGHERSAMALCGSAVIWASGMVCLCCSRDVTLCAGPRHGIVWM